jgi:endonuclease/exonuclease/phosphatase family metal-dependent hydrolase/uncharacterized protein YraI
MMTMIRTAHQFPLVVLACALTLVAMLIGCERAPGRVLGGPRAATEQGAVGTVIEAGARVRVRAKNTHGVPLHPGPGDGAVSGRLNDGAVVRIGRIDQATGWLQVEGAGQRGWIVRRYVDQRGDGARRDGKRRGDKRRGDKRRGDKRRGNISDGHAHTTRRDEPATKLPADHPAASRKACLAKLEAAKPGGLQAPGPAGARPYVATMNVRWFPDGKPGKRPRQDGVHTDTAWLACLLALTGAEAIALQEIKTLKRAQQAMDEVIAALNKHTAGDWRFDADSCPDKASLHVGVLWDAKRAQQTRRPKTFAALNPTGEACKNHLRPGLGVGLKLSDGTKLTLVSAHFKSGTKRRSLKLRQASAAQLGAVASAVRAPAIVAGDFNTMGCGRCSPKVSAQDDRAVLAKLAGDAAMGLVEPAPACSHTYRGHPGLLDGFVVADALRAGRTIRAWPAGYCDALACKPGRVRGLPVVRQVSDHCPLVLGW